MHTPGQRHRHVAKNNTLLGRFAHAQGNKRGATKIQDMKMRRNQERMVQEFVTQIWGAMNMGLK